MEKHAARPLSGRPAAIDLISECPCSIGQLRISFLCGRAAGGRLIRPCLVSPFVQPLAPGLKLPSPRAAPWGVTLFGSTLSRQPHWGCRGTGDMKRGRQYGVAVSLLLPCSVLVACSDEPIRPAPVSERRSWNACDQVGGGEARHARYAVRHRWTQSILRRHCRGEPCVKAGHHRSQPAIASLQTEDRASSEDSSRCHSHHHDTQQNCRCFDGTPPTPDSRGGYEIVREEQTGIRRVDPAG